MFINEKGNILYNYVILCFVIRVMILLKIGMGNNKVN